MNYKENNINTLLSPKKKNFSIVSNKNSKNIIDLKDNFKNIEPRSKSAKNSRYPNLPEFNFAPQVVSAPFKFKHNNKISVDEIQNEIKSLTNHSELNSLNYNYFKKRKSISEMVNYDNYTSKEKELSRINNTNQNNRENEKETLFEIKSVNPHQKYYDIANNRKIYNSYFNQYSTDKDLSKATTNASSKNLSAENLIYKTETIESKYNIIKYLKEFRSDVETYYQNTNRKKPVLKDIKTIKDSCLVNKIEKNKTEPSEIMKSFKNQIDKVENKDNKDNFYDTVIHDVSPHSPHSVIEDDLYDDEYDEYYRASSHKSHFSSILGNREYLKFRQIYEICKPSQLKNPKYFFKLYINFKVIRYTLIDNGFKENSPGDNNEFNLIWNSCGYTPSVLYTLQWYQKVNHFPSSSELTKKDSLYKNYVNMRIRYGITHYDFMPLSYVLPVDKDKLMNEMDGKKFYIVKPTNDSQGRGIYLIKKFSEIRSVHGLIVSEYLAKPYLIDGLKFDIRLYVIVTSYYPLRAYIYDEGLVRFASEQYKSPSKNMKEIFSHLTNYSINKFNENFEENEYEDEDNQGHKWSYSALWTYLQQKKVNVTRIHSQIEDIIVKSLLSVERSISAAVNAQVQYKGNCFECYGYDILLEEDYKPYLLEVNRSPSFTCGSPLDLKIKAALVRDTLDLIGIISHNSHSTLSKYDVNPLFNGGKGIKLASRSKFSENINKCEDWTKMNKIIRTSYGLDPEQLSWDEKYHLRDFEDELRRAKNMQCIFPSPKYCLYKDLMDDHMNVNELLARKFRKD